MSFKDHDKKNFIADVARDFAARRISKRDFMKKMALAGVGFSAFSAGLLGNTRGFRGDLSLIGTEAMAQDASVTQWLKDVGSPFKGTKIRYTSEATPPTVVLDKIKKEFTDPTGIEVEVEIVPLEQVLAKATQDVQGQLGTYDLYYLDQS
jgi:multiple sugar transport system substrate-binding protein